MTPAVTASDSLSHPIDNHLHKYLRRCSILGQRPLLLLSLSPSNHCRSELVYRIVIGWTSLPVVHFIRYAKEGPLDACMTLGPCVWYVVIHPRH